MPPNFQWLGILICMSCGALPLLFLRALSLVGCRGMRPVGWQSLLHHPHMPVPGNTVYVVRSGGVMSAIVRRKGWRHPTYRIMLSGRPYLTPLGIDIGPASVPLICTDSVASVYRACIRSINHSLMPYVLKLRNRYAWEMRSKALWKSSVRMYKGVPVVL